MIRYVLFYFSLHIDSNYPYYTLSSFGYILVFWKPLLTKRIAIHSFQQLSLLLLPLPLPSELVSY